MSGKFVISKRSNGEYQFNLKASNGQVVLTSEGYKDRAGCENGIASVKKFPFDAKTAVGSMNHLAFHMEEDELETALERLQEAGVPHTHMVFNHDDSPSGYAKETHEGVFVRSVYFTDPNGIMLEFAATTRDFGPADVRHAPARLAEGG